MLNHPLLTLKVSGAISFISCHSRLRIRDTLNDTLKRVAYYDLEIVVCCAFMFYLVCFRTPLHQENF